MRKHKHCTLEIPFLNMDPTRCDLDVVMEAEKPVLLVFSARPDNKGPDLEAQVGRAVTELAKKTQTQPDKIEVFVRMSERNIQPITFSNGGNSTIQGGGTLWIQSSDGPKIEKEVLDKKLAPAELRPMLAASLELEDSTPTPTLELEDSTPAATLELEDSTPAATLEGVDMPQMDWLDMAEKNDPITAAMYKAEVAAENAAPEPQKAASLKTLEATEKTAPPITLDDDFGQDC